MLGNSRKESILGGGEPTWSKTTVTATCGTVELRDMPHISIPRYHEGGAAPGRLFQNKGKLYQPTAFIFAIEPSLCIYLQHPKLPINSALLNNSKQTLVSIPKAWYIDSVYSRTYQASNELIMLCFLNANMQIKILFLKGDSALSAFNCSH